MANNAPVTFPYEFTRHENQPSVWRAIFHDQDWGDTHTTSLNTEGLKGTLTLTDQGLFDVFLYDPGTEFDYLAEGETATTSFTYTITDQHGASGTSTVSITITGKNDGPVASSVYAGTVEDGAVVISPHFSDADTNDSHTITVETDGTLGTVTVNEDGNFTYDPNGQFDDLDQGEFSFDSFTYTITDESGATSTETVNVTVNGRGEAVTTQGESTASDGALRDSFDTSLIAEGVTHSNLYEDDFAFV
ncbi:hypothetical protein PsAD13_04079 [Pseudovibrio sp. Ad13]|uniref:VCBS domain-containing protein n=1 Tax=Pseudovibrio sp. Ad13 TaxID=989396 RepID=UPI0007AEA5AB|nr:VCBS domain-containing protein [Pseudovibrio sp. Ad13]KZK81137.1 hypothetical protein PsAD13_04079 [Pseudovibrio sp. Ad13]